MALRRLLPIPILILASVHLQFAQYGPSSMMEFISIASGEFQMGCTVQVQSCVRQPPARSVSIERSFEAGKFQVTREQWKLVMGEYPDQTKDDPKSRALVSWDDTQLFIQKLNQGNDGYHYRLPTDAEWEYMARSGSPNASQQLGDGVYAYGQAPLRTDFILLKMVPGINQSDDLNCSIDYSRMTPSMEYKCTRSKVSTPERSENLAQPPRPYFAPRYFRNAWGLYDMIGEAPEWIEDWPKSESSQRIVRGSIETGNLGPMRVFVIDNQVSSKLYISRSTRSYYGFRCVRELD